MTTSGRWKMCMTQNPSLPWKCVNRVAESFTICSANGKNMALFPVHSNPIQRLQILFSPPPRRPDLAKNMENTFLLQNLSSSIQTFTFTFWNAVSWKLTNWLLRNPEVHYSPHLSTPMAPILSKSYPIYRNTIHLLQIHFNIILPSTSH